MVISQNSGKEKIQATVAFIRRNAGLDLGIGGEPECSAGCFSLRAAKISTIFLHIELGKNRPQTVTVVSERPSWRGESCCLPSRPPFSSTWRTRRPEARAAGDPKAKGTAVSCCVGCVRDAGPASLQGLHEGQWKQPTCLRSLYPSSAPSLS